MRKSIFLAIAITVVAAGWVLSGEFGDKVGLANGKAAQGPAPSVAERNEARGEAALTAVRTKISIAKQHWRAVTAWGHTEAKRKVMIKSEIKGRIIKVSVQKGQKVRRGDELVRIDVADRDAHMAEAKALVRQREVEFQAANKLRKKGYRAETQHSAAAARLDAAHAMVKQMEVALGRTVIRAPFDATVDSREVELGAYVKDGSGIALLVVEDPYLVVAQVSENDVGRLRRNGKGRAVLVTGQTVKVRMHISWMAGRAHTSCGVTWRTRWNSLSSIYSIPWTPFSQLSAKITKQPGFFPELKTCFHATIRRALTTRSRMNRKGLRNSI